MRNLIFILGAPAVGKMTVGKALSRRLGYPLLHNHVSVELALEFFPFGSKGFGEISNAIRQSVLRAVAISDKPGLIFTFVWALDLEEDAAYAREIADDWVRRTLGNVLFLELVAGEAVKQERNRHPDRLAAKPSKRDVATSEERRRKIEETHIFDSQDLSGEDNFPLAYPHLRIDNSALTPEEVAEEVVAAFGL